MLRFRLHFWVWSAIGCAIVLWWVGTRTGEGGKPGELSKGASVTSISPPKPNAGPAAKIEKKLLGVVAARPPTAEERQMGERLSAAAGNLRPLSSAAPGPRTTTPSADLLPKPPKLSAAQKRVLQKLRWGPTKDLNYRGDGDDATVRTLAATALAEPVDSVAPAAQVLGFVAEHRELFLLENPNDELLVTSVEDEPKGGKVVRLGQRYQGLEVWPGQMVANVSAQGYLTVIAGAYAPTPASASLSSQISPAEAVAAARLHLGQPNGPSATRAPATLKIFADKGRAPELAFDVQIEVPGKHHRVFVSAENARILLSYSEICSAAVVGSGTDLFGQSRTLNVYSSGSPLRYYLMDTGKPMYSAAAGTGVIRIYDGSVSNWPIASSPSLNGGFNAAAVSAAYNLGKVYDFYRTVFGRDSYDGAGASISGLVNDPEFEDNAYWDSQRRLFGFGGAQNYAGASDVVGHEFSHAVITHTANLKYEGESGALNESMADVLGESFERYLAGSADWLMGTRLTSPVRSLSSPRSKGQPATMSEFVRTSQDNGGVHINSGIPNHAFYLLAEGLPVGGIGFENARNIFYRALTTKLNARSTFLDLRDACKLSATELFGAGSLQVVRTGQAFDAVEIFDANLVGFPENLTPPSGPDSYLFAYKAVDGNSYLGRREAALGDGTSVTAISTYPVNINSRTSVSGNGVLAAFVSAAHDVVIVETNGASGAAVGVPGLVNAVALSADGRHFAMIPRDPVTGMPISSILYVNTTTQVSETIDLYLPVTSEQSSIRISAVDEVDLSPDGQIALFDGLATTSFGDGTSVRAWAVFAVDLKSKSIYALAGPLTGVDIGNPSFARTSSSRIVLEAVSSEGNFILAADWTKPAIAEVAGFTPGNYYYAYPRFSAGDDFVVFTEQYFSFSTLNYQPRVSRIALIADRMTPLGSSAALQNLAYNGLSYRRGTFAGAPMLSVVAQTASLTKGQAGSFRVSRTSGDQAIRVPVTFKMLGTARPNFDYGQIEPSILLPAGATFVDIPVTAAPSLGAGTRTLTLSLDPQYYYIVSATGGSATMSIVGPADQTISFGPLADKVYGAAPFAVSATASSGLPVSIGVVSGPATVANGTLSITGAGTVTVRASQSGNASFNAAPAVDRTFTVAKAPLAFTAADKSKVYGAPNPTLTGVYSGFVNGDTLGSVTPPSFSTTATAASPVGTYPITLTGGTAANYTFTLNHGTLTVIRAPLTVTALSQSRTYGAPNPPLSIAYAGFVNNDTASAVGAPTAGTTATVTSPVGSYPITLTGGSAANYALTMVPGTLAVTKAPLTVRADDKTKVAGAPNPPLTVAYVGLVNGEGDGVIDVRPSIGTSATAESAPGDYPITLTGGSDDNYTLTLQNGVLTVTSPPTAPVIVVPPVGQTVNAGDTVVLAVVAAGTAPLSYQWRKAGMVLSAATSAELTLGNVQPSDSGSYDVVVSNGADPAAISVAARLNVVPAGVGAMHALDSPVTDGIATISNRFTHAGSIAELHWSIALPAGASLLSTEAAGADVKPTSGAGSLLEWRWTTVPSGPVTFTYRITMPAGESLTRSLAALVDFKFQGTPIQITAKPDPLSIGERHSADIDGNNRISLSELTRVIELFNTRNGTERTGAYKVELAGAEDGFAIDATRIGGVSAVLSRYHSADTRGVSAGTPRDGAIQLDELLRVIQLYNHRAGTVRTGQYRWEAATEDGFAPGPAW